MYFYGLPKQATSNESCKLPVQNAPNGDCTLQKQTNAYSISTASLGRTQSTYQNNLTARFDYLSKNGNSSCSGDFPNSISGMLDDARLQGSCCSPMDLNGYKEQTTGLEKYKAFTEVPPDPYDIEAGLAKKLMAYDGSIKLSGEEQKAYDYAMKDSKEKGPCCCKCWRWKVYGGLAKHLIKDKGFTGEQVTEIWNLSDGCGGEGDKQTGL